MGQGYLHDIEDGVRNPTGDHNIQLVLYLLMQPQKACTFTHCLSMPLDKQM